MDDTTKKELQSATLERLIHHLRERNREEAKKKGIEISDPDARKHIYGMPYEQWKTKFQNNK